MSPVMPSATKSCAGSPLILVKGWHCDGRAAGQAGRRVGQGFPKRVSMRLDAASRATRRTERKAGLALDDGQRLVREQFDEQLADRPLAELRLEREFDPGRCSPG
jgi:hypothetical protein